MTRRSRLRGAAAALAVLLAAPPAAWAADAGRAVSEPGADVLLRPAPVVRVAAGCVGFCRGYYPPCRVGSRWYGPYGYVCYRPEPASIVIR